MTSTYKGMHLAAVLPKTYFFIFPLLAGIPWTLQNRCTAPGPQLRMQPSSTTWMDSASNWLLKRVPFSHGTSPSLNRILSVKNLLRFKARTRSILKEHADLIFDRGVLCRFLSERDTPAFLPAQVDQSAGVSAAPFGGPAVVPTPSLLASSFPPFYISSFTMSRSPSYILC